MEQAGQSPLGSTIGRGPKLDFDPPASIDAGGSMTTSMNTQSRSFDLHTSPPLGLGGRAFAKIPSSVRQGSILDESAHNCQGESAPSLLPDGRCNIFGKCPKEADFRSGGEIGHQLYEKFETGKLDGVNLKSTPAHEAQNAGDASWWLDAARATPK